MLLDAEETCMMVQGWVKAWRANCAGIIRAMTIHYISISGTKIPKTFGCAQYASFTF